MGRTKAATLTGIAAGVAFFAHAMVQNSHAWPLLWTFLAGVLAIVLSSTREAHNAGAAIASGALAGLIAGIIFVVASFIALFVLGIPEEAAREVGDRQSAVLLAFAVAAAIGVVVAAAGAAVAHFLFARKS
jgi:small-conductance mechanosensitive channel